MKIRIRPETWITFILLLLVVFGLWLSSVTGTDIWNGERL